MAGMVFSAGLSAVDMASRKHRMPDLVAFEAAICDTIAAIPPIAR